MSSKQFTINKDLGAWMSAVSGLLISVAANLVTPIFEHYSTKISSPLKRRVVKSRLESVAMTAFANLEDYFKSEIPDAEDEGKILRIINSTSKIVAETFKDPSHFLDSSLETKLFVAGHIEEHGFPEEIIEDDTTTPFLHFFSACVRMLLELPDIMEEWKVEAWKSSFRKLDILAQLLEEQTNRVKEVSDQVSSHFGASKRGMVALKAALLQADARSEVEMHGLSRAQASPLQLRSIFVSPELEVTEKSSGTKENFGTESAISLLFSKPGKIHRIFGEAGSGKTTLVRWVEQNHWQHGHRFAVKFDLRIVSKQDELPNIVDLLDRTIPKDLRGTLTKADFKTWLDEGTVVLIFDGFDEVSQPKRTSVCNWIKSSCIGLHDSNTFIVTSRPLTTDHLDDKHWKGCSAIKVLGFDQPRVVKYITKWQQHMLTPQEKEILEEDETPASLADIFTSAETIKELTANPLLLSTLMMVHRFEGKKLPEGRSELYRIYVDGMLGQWYSKAENSDYMKLDSSYMRKTLRIIAVKMQVAEISAVDEDLAADWISSDNTTGHSSKRVLEHMLERTGLLIGPGEYQFAHKSIGEFLVAEAIVSEQVRIDDELIDRLYLLKKAPIDSWRVVLFLWAGLVPSKMDLIEFCRFLLQQGEVGVALGLIDEFYDELAADHPSKLVEILRESVSVPDRRCVDLKTNGGSSFSFLGEVFGGMPGAIQVSRKRYLTISGEDSFGDSLFGGGKVAKEIPLDSWSNQVGDSTYYFDLWVSWVEQGGDLQALVDKAPGFMSSCQGLLLASQLRGMAFEGSAKSKSLNPFFYIPIIVGKIHEVHYSGQHDENTSEDNQELWRNARVFMESFDVASWHDFWFKTLLTKKNVAAFDQRSKRRATQWSVDAGLPKIDLSDKKMCENSRYVIQEYLDERVKRLEKFKNDGKHFYCENGILFTVDPNETPKTLDSIFGPTVMASAKKTLHMTMNSDQT
jgi:hypothetical protein